MKHRANRRLNRSLPVAAAALLVLPACSDDRPAPPPQGSAAPSSPAATTPGSPSATPSATRPPAPTVPTPASAALTATIERFGAKKLGWRGCGDGFECAMLTVPLDYDAPDGETIDVSVIRLKARGKRIGSLVLNPGGPGGSGVEFARQARQLLPGEILDRFDAVSFDPRGVGESAPVDCYGDAQLDELLSIDPAPEDKAEYAKLLKAAKDQAAQCAAKSGKLLPHLGTVDTAKDLDVLREALGDDKLTYVGFSYGTLLGARYAQQFPGNVRALVLDGAVDPALTPREISLAQAEGFQHALNVFLDDCERQRCDFAKHGLIYDTIDELLARIERRPLEASAHPGRTVGPSEALFGIAAALYSREYGWPVLRPALEEAYSERDGSKLLALFDNLVERDENGRYSNAIEAQAAVSCVDSVYERDPEEYTRDASVYGKLAPHFGQALAYGSLVCAFWPAPPVTRPGPIRVEGKPPIVVVGTTGDPATPYAWSKSLAGQLPARLVTYEGEGHTAYGYGRSSCVDRVVDAFLISLTLPAPGTRCR